MQTSCPQPTYQDSSSQFVLFDLKMLCEMLQPLQCPHFSKAFLHIGGIGAMMGYAVVVALLCGSCGRELSCYRGWRLISTNPSALLCQLCDGSKGDRLLPDGIGTDDVANEYMRSLHHQLSSISSTIQSKLYGVAADTLRDSHHHAVHRVYNEMYGPCEGRRQLAVSYDNT